MSVGATLSPRFIAALRSFTNIGQAGSPLPFGSPLRAKFTRNDDAMPAS